MKRPTTSVIIRTYNEEKHLPALFEALQKQAARAFEVIVVDSGSLDRTLAIARQHADKVVQIQSRDFTFGYSLNMGIREARGDFMAIVSAHTLPIGPDWLEKLIAPLQDEKTAMVYGRQLGDKSSKFSEIQDLRRAFGSHRKVMAPPHFFANNANSAVDRTLWQQHPFDESLPGLEDIAWAKHWMEQGYQVIYEPEAALYHIHEESWPQVRRRYYREAVAARWIGIRSRWHAFASPLAEAGRVCSDFGRLLPLFVTGKQPVRRFRGLAQEILQFRAHKAAGTARGLMDGAEMTDPETRTRIYFDRSCKGVVIEGPHQAHYKDITIPEVKPGDVLIRVAFEAVCATDIEIFEGQLGYYQNGMAHYPITPGHEFSGRVVMTGPNVQNLAPGDPVVVECIQSCGACDACRRNNPIGCRERTELGVMGRDGGYAEYVVVPGRFVHRLPQDLDLRKGCLCEPLAVVLKGLRRLGRARQIEDQPLACAVVGAGPLGHLCARVLAHRGHAVTVFDRNPERLRYFEGSEIQTATDARQLHAFDILIEVTGDPEALELILHESPAGATILLLGLPYSRRPFTFENIVAFDKTVVGSVGSSSEDFEAAIALLPDLETDAFMQKVMPLAAFDQAWQLAKTAKHLKIILQPDTSP